ncbi:hypothetical protein EVAR_54383_1 [Eumeta japonica]|uniref:Uncharacterized protein n=1 Tax=Eumeta variegata TaxID=151549 RepID=A0A4C1Y6N5_EUMVA|nr:hypothetical protein EVAR_54383_1 [Eumeta japonica]
MDEMNDAVLYYAMRPHFCAGTDIIEPISTPDIFLPILKQRRRRYLRTYLSAYSVDIDHSSRRSVYRTCHTHAVTYFRRSVHLIPTRGPGQSGTGVCEVASNVQRPPAPKALARNLCAGSGSRRDAVPGQTVEAGGAAVRRGRRQVRRLRGQDRQKDADILRSEGSGVVSRRIG